MKKFLSSLLSTLALTASIATGQSVLIVGEGKECRPSFRFGPICDDNLTCQTPQPGAPGICCRQVGLGDACGAAIFPSPQCGPRLTCVKPTVTRPGISGVCYPAAYLGDKCGGSIRYPPACVAGTCVYRSPRRMGAQGTCQ